MLFLCKNLTISCSDNTTVPHTICSKRLELCDFYLVTTAWVHRVCMGQTWPASNWHGSQAVANSLVSKPKAATLNTVCP